MSGGDARALQPQERQAGPKFFQNSMKTTYFHDKITASVCGYAWMLFLYAHGRPKEDCQHS